MHFWQSLEFENGNEEAGMTLDSEFSLEEFAQSGAIMTLKEDLLLVGWGKRRFINYQACIRQNTPAFYFPDFFLKNTDPWFIHPKWKIVTRDELLGKFSYQKERYVFQWQNPDFVHFQSTFHDLQALFNAHRILKAVPYVFETCSQRMHLQLFRHLLYSIIQYINHKPLYLYGLWSEKEGMLGATPEILFRYEKGNPLETLACAGTCAHTEDHQEFLTNSKERLEHQLVVEGITESLTPFGTVNLGHIATLKLPTLSHLITPIQVNLRDPFDYESIVKALHPTPALGAFPRKEGMDWLKAYDQLVKRKRFGSPAGYFFPSKEEYGCFVSIRNMQWEKEILAIGAGCGIVAASSLEKEWREVNLKIQAIKDMLAL